MAMTVGTGGGRGGVTPLMNVTPLVDVVLVLLILFMVITPLMSRKFWIHTPKQEKKAVEPEELDQDPTPPLVLRVGSDRAISVNTTALGFEELPQRLRRMFAARDDHVLFVDIADDVPYAFAVEVLDQARAGGAVTIAALTIPLSTPSAAGGPAPPSDAAP
jgi:biopolymer transport protein ExbD/biopolymer transport protein TolR